MTEWTPAVAALAAMAVVACAPDPAERITADGIMTAVLALSADSMEGRAPGTPGEERAIRYIEERFAAIGLEPAAGSYGLPVELVGLTRDPASLATIRGPGGSLALERDVTFTYWSTAEAPAVELRDVPIVFVGYGVEAPEHDWDDFKGADVAGKVLLFLNDDPPVEEDGRALFGGPARTYYGRWTYKFEQADRHGAAGAIVIHTTESASYGFSVIGDTGARQIWQRGYRLPLLAWIDSTRSEQLAAGMGTTLDELFRMAAKRDFRPVDTGYRLDASIQTAIEQVQTRNVAGVVRGTDPQLADQYVVFTAHHDHLGMREGSDDEDRIFNGALDNALGVASMIAMAEAFAADPPRRSLMFVSVTAEEGGLLGSGAFVADPPVPLGSIVANINIDSPQMFGVTRDVAAIGLDASTIGEAFAALADELGLRAVGDLNPGAGSFYRSDQINFAKAGIPALYLQGGKDYVEELGLDPEEYRNARYHQVTDEVTDAWGLAGTERDLRFLFRVVRDVANADDPPRWVPGNEFEDEWRTLYGRD